MAELPECPSRFTKKTKRASNLAYDNSGDWTALVQKRFFSEHYCMDSTEVSPSGFKQRVSGKSKQEV